MSKRRTAVPPAWWQKRPRDQVMSDVALASKAIAAGAAIKKLPSQFDGDSLTIRKNGLRMRKNMTIGRRDQIFRHQHPRRWN